MKRYALLTIVLTLAMSMVVLPGCVNQTAEQKWATSMQVYIATAEALATYMEAGKVDAEQIERIKAVDRVAWAALEAWRSAIDAGDEYSNAHMAFLAALGALEQELAQLKWKEVERVPSD